MHFNLVRTELDCSPVLFGRKKTVANTICVLLELKVVVMQSYFTFFFPPSFFLVLNRSSGWFWQKAADGPWSTARVLNALPNCLSWIRFSLCHGLGSSCRTDAFQFCLLVCYTESCALHWQRAGGLWKGKKNTPQNQKTHICNFFLYCLQILVTYWLQLDV